MLTCVSLPPNLKLLHQLNIANMLPFQPAEPDLDLRVSPPSTARPQEILTLPSTGAFSLPTPPPPKNQILPPLRLLVSCLPSFLLLKRKPPRQTGLIHASFTPLPNLSIIQQTNPAEKYPKKGHSTLQVLPLQQTTPAQKHPTKGRPGLQVLPLAARRIPPLFPVWQPGRAPSVVIYPPPPRPPVVRQPGSAPGRPAPPSSHSLSRALVTHQRQPPPNPHHPRQGHKPTSRQRHSRKASSLPEPSQQLLIDLN